MLVTTRAYHSQVPMAIARAHEPTSSRAHEPTSPRAHGLRYMYAPPPDLPHGLNPWKGMGRCSFSHLPNRACAWLCLVVLVLSDWGNWTPSTQPPAPAQLQSSSMHDEQLAQLCHPPATPSSPCRPTVVLLLRSLPLPPPAAPVAVAVAIAVATATAIAAAIATATVTPTTRTACPSTSLNVFFFVLVSL
eukprot:CAMPEP_0182523952 /NCGR_PEP_ID=MMETSP1323-20130603/1451_1 /TAXON_ID=236787 /ORGANISM="Florenciella parvula, Strain RCC1693" /LENGTH=189 /DNA_ID=CAMNT_0024732435 /DNA_START=200 /DNA_END=768 /DNA_ORIENTATION=+